MFNICGLIFCCRCKIVQIVEPAIAMSWDLLLPPLCLQQIDNQERNKPILQISESSLIQNLNVILKFWIAFSCKLPSSLGS